MLRLIRTVKHAVCFEHEYLIWFRRRFRYFGIDSEIQHPSIIPQPQNIFLGDKTTILKHSRIQTYFLEGQETAQITIGKGCFVGYNFSLLAGANVTIGDSVLIASNVLISSENHGMNPESHLPYMQQPLVGRPVVVGDGAWLGEKVCILPGVSIGVKAVIGAGSVVTADVPDYSVAVGAPARVIKRYDFGLHQWVGVQS